MQELSLELNPNHTKPTVTKTDMQTNKLEGLALSPCGYNI